jgi:glycosyltransferase involved in cell wall biosynthesis
MTGPAAGPAKIAYILPRLEMGGTEKHVRDLVRRLDRERFLPVVIATVEGGPLEADFADMGIPVHIIGYEGFTRRRGQVLRRIRMAMASIRNLADILRREDTAIVHAYLPAANVLGTIGGRLAGIPRIVVSKRGLCHYKKGRPILAFFENIANLSADAVLVNSDAVAAAVRSAERFCGRKILRIYNGIDPENFAVDAAVTNPPLSPVSGVHLPGDAVRILCVANFFPYKGHTDLVEAAARVIPRFPAAYFLLAGRDSGELAMVTAHIEALGLGRNVLVIGERGDISTLLGSASFLVHPSHEEGFSNTILEAMGAGKAVVATDVGGIPEAVEEGVTGILVPPRNPQRLAEAMLSLLENPARARAMGEAGQKRVRDLFPLRKMVHEIETLYEELLHGGKNPCAG